MLFGAIGIAAIVKKGKTKASNTKTETAQIAVQSPPLAAQVIELDIASLQPQNSVKPAPVQAEARATQQVTVQSPQEPIAQINFCDIPDCDRIGLLFQKNSPLPIVETISYKSKVSWKTGRSAWLVDYAAHYKTHLHFIARSMNGKADYNPRPAAEGQTFNVLASNVNFYFYSVIDISRCKMMLFAVLPDTQERVLLKTYKVGLGRLDSSKASGSLTPVGKYSLGSRIAIYQPKMMGNYRGKRTEMITVFGTRWIPFEKELASCSEPAKGYGIHGTPWHLNGDGKLVDNTESIGKYESDGCIRMRAQDIEEIFSIISTHQSVVEIVNDYSKVVLPGKDKMY